MQRAAFDTRRAMACRSCALTACPLRSAAAPAAAQRYISMARGDRVESNDSKACLQFWIVIQGTAATCTTFTDGRRQILNIEGPGDVICRLMAGPGTQNWLEALDECIVCEIDLSADSSRLHRDPSFLSASFGIVHRRLTRSEMHLSTLGRLDSNERVLLFLVEMAMRNAAAVPKTPVTTLHMSREDIADYLGLNAETVSRILTRVRKSGLVKFLTRNEYVLPDLEAFARRLPVDLPSPETFRPVQPLMEAVQ